MYNYQGQPQYGQPASYGYGGQASGPPGTVPPGMGPPSASSPPGTGNRLNQNQRRGGFPPDFQPPPNMSNINFSAPIIRLGTGSSSKADSTTGMRRDSNQEPLGQNRRGAGLGYENRGQDQQRHQQRQDTALVPPTREEVARTIFVNGIPASYKGDEGIERILGVAGGLRKWVRAVDADGKYSKFGFAEYEDADSLNVASQLFQDLEIPVRRSGYATELNGEVEVEKVRVQVTMDQQSQKYIEDWRNRGSLKDPAETQFRLDTAKEELFSILSGLASNQSAQIERITTDAEGDTVMQERETKVDITTGEVVTIPLTAEDELSDIPPEMRETVAREIAAFRERSNRRDMERLRQQEEMERASNSNTQKVERFTSPLLPGNPTTMVSVNGVPLGPRGAPTGPKNLQNSQNLREHSKTATSGVGNNSGGIDAETEEENTDASDEELERRRLQKKKTEQDKLFAEQERRWLRNERSRIAAIERQKQRDLEEEAARSKIKSATAKWLKDFDDDVEASRKEHEYYFDHSHWLRNRELFRAREREADERDRMQEERELIREKEAKDREMGMADQFLARQAEEMESKPEPREAMKFKLSLGTSMQRANAPREVKRTAVEVENLLDDEEDAAGTVKRTLRPIQFDATSQTALLSHEERQEAQRQLAGEIPNETEQLWNYAIPWEFVDEGVIKEELRPFVEKKIMEYLGIQEEMLVDVVERCLVKRARPEEVVEELKEALDEEAEPLVKKLWRMLIFFSESEKRGIAS